MKKDEMMTMLDQSIIEDIIERSIKFYKGDSRFNAHLLFHTLCELRGVHSIFELIEHERNKIIETETSLLQQNDIRP